MTRSETRAELIRIGSEIIVRQGYNNTGINAVLTAAGVPKGSFYYYFSNKEDFGLAVIDDFAAHYMSRLDAVLGDRDVSPMQRIRNYFEAGMEEVAANEFGGGCLIGNLGQELAGQSEVFRSRLDQVFRSWKQRFVQVLTEARDAGELTCDADPEQLAEFLLSGWEGAILRAKVTRSVEPMRAFVDLFLDRVLKAA
jgi:TetR/AcrR family transcriptional repressor of nem operon